MTPVAFVIFIVVVELSLLPKGGRVGSVAGNQMPHAAYCPPAIIHGQTNCCSQIRMPSRTVRIME
jgi:hypothetical protein